jgi:quinol-cytochrome oxidoreductase complex cytochrome b subunit
MSKWMRQFHRWVSMLFVLTVIANFVAMGVQGAQRQPDVITYAPLFPLFILVLTGLYMFFLPYVTRRRPA